jgi:hypothetical protein
MDRDREQIAERQVGDSSGNAAIHGGDDGPAIDRVIDGRGGLQNGLMVGGCRSGSSASPHAR